MINEFSNFFKNKFFFSKLIRFFLIPFRLSVLNILETFPIFVAYGWGSYKSRVQLTIESINQVNPALARLSRLSDKNLKFQKELIKSYNLKKKKQTQNLEIYLLSMEVISLIVMIMI